MFEFEVKYNNAILTRYWGQDEHVVVPKYINGNIPVTEIEEEAFFASKVKTILLPETITHIGDRAFFKSTLKWIGCNSTLEDSENGISCIRVSWIGSNCFEGTSLEDIIFDSLSEKLTLCESSFANTSSLRNVIISNNTKRLVLSSACFYRSHIETCLLPITPGVLEKIPEKCFAGCVSLRGLLFRVNHIEREAFLANKELRSIPLFEGLQTIGSNAFRLCTNVSELRLPASCASLSPNAFEITGVTAFSVDENNPYFCCEEGVIYSKDKTKLISFPPARGSSFSIPEGIVAVAEHAFHDSNLSSINFSSTVRVIEARAFDGADKLTDLYLPDSLSFLGEDAFSHCHKLYSVSIPSNLKLDWEDSFYGLHLREVHYRGSKGDFEKQISGDLANENANFFFEDAYGQEYKEATCRRRTLQFEYTVYPDGIKIDKVFPILPKVVIPEMMAVDGENYFVTEIGYAAFPEICEEIYIPETVRDAPGAVAGCAFLRKLTMPVDLWIEPATIPKNCVINRY